MKTKPKILHPNKLVQQHDEYLIDKSLVTRVKSAKTTIKNSNTFFENRLKSRNKGRFDTGMKPGDYQMETLAFEPNYKPNIYEMDENLLNYLKNNENSKELINQDLTFAKKKSGFKSSDFKGNIVKNPNFTKESARTVKNQFPTEKINKKKEIFKNDLKTESNEDYFDDFEQDEQYFIEKRENSRYKNIEENQLKKPKIIDDTSHCNFDSPEIYITSKGLLRNSTYKPDKTMAKIGEIVIKD